MPSIEQTVLDKVNELIGSADPKTAERLGDIAEDFKKINKKHDNSRVIRRFISDDNDDTIPILRKFYKEGTRELHCEDGPAVIFHNGIEHWYKNGKKHRVDGPAVEHPNGTYEHWVDGVRHRDDGPAILDKYGVQTWYRAGKVHREDGPAITEPDGKEMYFINNQEVAPFKFAPSLTAEFDPIFKAIEKFQDKAKKNDSKEALSTLNEFIEDIQKYVGEKIQFAKYSPSASEFESDTIAAALDSTLTAASYASRTRNVAAVNRKQVKEKTLEDQMKEMLSKFATLQAQVSEISGNTPAIVDPPKDGPGADGRDKFNEMWKAEIEASGKEDNKVDEAISQDPEYPAIEALVQKVRKEGISALAPKKAKKVKKAKNATKKMKEAHKNENVEQVVADKMHHINHRDAENLEKEEERISELQESYKAMPSAGLGVAAQAVVESVTA